MSCEQRKHGYGTDIPARAQHAAQRILGAYQRTSEEASVVHFLYVVCKPCRARIEMIPCTEQLPRDIWKLCLVCKDEYR